MNPEALRDYLSICNEQRNKFINDTALALHAKHLTDDNGQAAPCVAVCSLRGSLELPSSLSKCGARDGQQCWFSVPSSVATNASANDVRRISARNFAICRATRRFLHQRAE